MRETSFEKLHPAVCFAFLLAAICMAMLVQHPTYLGVSLAAALCLNLSVNGKRAIKGILGLFPLWVVLSAVNPLFNTLGEHVLFSYFGRPYTWEALCYGMAISSMFVAMLQWFAVYNAVMTEDKFSYLFGSLSPSLALLLTLVFRLIPNFMRKVKQIASARSCIGKGVAEGAGGKEKLKNGMSTLSVLTSWALENSVVTADSMNSRGYGTGNRSCYHSYKIGTADVCAIVLLVLLCALALIRGGGLAEYTPVIRIAPVRGKSIIGLAAYALFLLMPTICNLKEELQWYISKSKI